MKLNQFAVYQLKRSAETRKLCFRTYQNLMDEKIAVRAENYDQVYLAAALPGDSAEKIWQRLRDKPPKTFKGYHSISAVSYTHLLPALRKSCRRHSRNWKPYKSSLPPHRWR